MDAHLELLHRLAQKAPARIVLLVLDGVGDLRTIEQPQTALEKARTPNLDALATRSALGRLTPVAPGITPGSGPGHLSLFGYDPRRPEVDIGRGVLEALGLGLQVKRGQVAVRGNFATRDADGNLLDRRAGRPPTEECRRICAKMRTALEAAPVKGLQVRVEPGEAHRFVLILDGKDLSAELADTDPQKLGVPALPPRTLEAASESAAAKSTVERLKQALAVLREAIADEEQANEVLLRGFSAMPHLEPWDELYKLRAGAFAGYPLYRGVASACGMEVVPCGKRIGDILDTVTEHWSTPPATSEGEEGGFDFYFLHVKQTDQAGEDGNLAAKAEVLEEVDAALPRLLSLLPDVLAITGDHSTPAPMSAHSWHPVPLLLHAANAYIDDTQHFTEEACIRGHLGTMDARYLMGVLLANAGRLKKYGA